MLLDVLLTQVILHPKMVKTKLFGASTASDEGLNFTLDADAKVSGVAILYGRRKW